MHRKNIRRWPKLLSAASIIAALFGAIFVVQANASVTSSDGTLSLSSNSTRTSSDYIFFFIDERISTTGLSASDFEVLGQSCYLFGFYASAPQHQLYVTGCADGAVVQLKLTAASAIGSDGSYYPEFDLYSDPVFIDRQAPIGIWSGPAISNSGNPLFTLTVNEAIQVPDFNYLHSTGTSTGCTFIPTALTTGYQFELQGCSDGTVAMVLPPGGIMDYQWNSGPISELTSEFANIGNVAASPVASSAPTTAPTTAPTAEPTTAPTTAPTAEPTTAPTAEPTSAPTVTATPEAVAVVAPVEPPQAPPATPIAVAEPAPQPAPESDEPDSQLETPLTDLSPEADLSWFDFDVVRQTKVATAVIEEPQPISTAVESSIGLPKIRPVRSKSSNTFDWRPLGQFAIAFSGLLAATGAAIAIRKSVVRRRFSARLI